jgi:hypothetical protein
MRFTKRELIERETKRELSGGGKGFRLQVDRAFDNAISKGLTNPEDYMHMQTKSADGGLMVEDYFKHRDTKEYITYKR